MGDSYVFGYGVEQDEMFTSRMGAMCPSLDVVNLGVSGYGTDQELLLLKNEGLSYEPDIVVLVMVDNDYENNLRPRVYVYYQKPLYVMRNDELVLTNHPVRAPNVLVRWAGRVARHSYLLNQINRALIGWRSRGKQRAAQDQAGSAGTGADRAPRAFPTSPAETITADIVSEFLGTAEAAGVKSMIVFVEGQSGRGRGMADYFAQRDVAFVQLDEVMPPGTYDQYRLQGDPHWNPAGHQLVARTVLDRLLASGWLSADACAAHDASDALNTPAPTRSP